MLIYMQSQEDIVDYWVWNREFKGQLKFFNINKNRLKFYDINLI